MTADEPTITFFPDDEEAGVTVPVTALPGWHEHPECVGDDGHVLRHLHGTREQPTHTHLPVQTWGAAVPVRKVSRSGMP